MTRRNFGTRLAAAVAGIGAAAATATTASAADKNAKHVCKGMNECKGQGGGPKGVAGKNSCKGQGECATAAKHECKGHNDCKGQGGCSSGDHNCAGKNSCKGKGGCQVPMKAKKSQLRRRNDQPALG
jgi:hypothetical protein